MAEQLYFDPAKHRDLLERGGGVDGRASWEEMCPPETLGRFGELMKNAKAAARTPLQKQRVELFDKGCFQMMKASSEAWRRDYAPLTAQNSQMLPIKWRLKTDPQNKGREQRLFAEDLDDSGWTEVSTDQILEKQNIKGYTYAWYRVNARIPESRTDMKIRLRLGAVDESCWLWVNGQPAGQAIYDSARDPMSWTKPVSFDVTDFLRAGGDNQITVLVRNVWGAGGIWKPCALLFEETRSD